MTNMSRSALDRLGNRLRESDRPSTDDQELYDTYRASFADALVEIQRVCDDAIAFNVARAARLKTLESTAAKLRRGTFRLSQVSDIAGLRLVFNGIVNQERAIELIGQTFSDSRLIDYRESPQNGYRAVHAIVRSSQSKPVEVQLRTMSQDMWANTCEELAGRIDMAVKYGGGPPHIRRMLSQLSIRSHMVDLKLAIVERVPKRVEDLTSEMMTLQSKDPITANNARAEELLASAGAAIDEARAYLSEAQREWLDVRSALQELLSTIPEQ